MRLRESLVSSLVIVLADPNPFMRRITRSMLTTIGIRGVIEAADGVTALEAVKSTNPDLVLTEYDMPFIDGIEFTRILRSLDDSRRTPLPVVMLSSRSDRAMIVK